MTWRTLLQTGETMVLPWIGGRVLRSGDRVWNLNGMAPTDYGWFEFQPNARLAKLVRAVDAQPERLGHWVVGYLVGDRIISDDARVDPDPKTIADCSERVHLIDPGLDRFVRISAGRMCEDGPLIFGQQEMPVGPEWAVLQAYWNREASVNAIPGVPPALDAAFRMEVWQRAEADRRREELEEARREAEERQRLEARRAEIATRLGNAVGRREMARHDFQEAARAALAVGGAELLDFKKAPRPNEMIVRFRITALGRRHFECVCDALTLRIIDAGVCLTSHETGEKGDTFFTLESLPAVIIQADDEGKLVVFRHVN